MNMNEGTHCNGTKIWRGPYWTNSIVGEESFGIELAGRDMTEDFALRAPEPPYWFRPVMTERPVRPRRPSLDNGGELDRIIDAWHRDDCGNSLREFFSVGLSPDEADLVLEYELELESWQDELNQWELERERQRLAQWPWEYARLVMEARDGVA
jgi:hypothetical protein